jgi:hypothetical protein
MLPILWVTATNSHQEFADLSKKKRWWFLPLRDGRALMVLDLPTSGETVYDPACGTVECSLSTPLPE